MYFTTNELVNPGGGDIEQFMVFEALVDGISRCISYIGENQNTIGINTVDLRVGPFGYSNLGDCISCSIVASPTPTPTVTPTVTPTITPTPTPTPVENARYTYRRCDNESIYVVQSSPGPTTIPNNSFINLNDNKCWVFLYVTSGQPQINPINTIINYSGNYFTQTTNQIFTKCEDCNITLNTTTTTTKSLQEEYTINYDVTKTVDCSKVSGKILINDIINYNLNPDLVSGNYSGNFKVKNGDTVVFDFITNNNPQTCSPQKSKITIVDTKEIVFGMAEYDSENETIYNTYTITPDWLGNTIVISLTT
jgi:hypothetical protein